MKNFIKKNIIKILTIYKKTLENKDLIFDNYSDQAIYFEIEYLIKLIKERRNEK